MGWVAAMDDDGWKGIGFWLSLFQRVDPILQSVDLIPLSFTRPVSAALKPLVIVFFFMLANGLFMLIYNCADTYDYTRSEVV